MELDAYLRSLAAWAEPMKAAFIQAGGVFDAAFAVFHLAFPWLFDWRQDLRTLTFINRGIVRVMNLCLAAVFAVFAWLALAHTPELTTLPLGRSLLAGIALFWLLRAVLQLAFFKMRYWWSWAFFLLFLSGAVLHGIPAAVGWPA